MGSSEEVVEQVDEARDHRFAAIRSQVEASGNLIVLTAEQLRDAYGVRKLGVRVRAGISQELFDEGLGHIPEEIPDDRRAEIRIYRLGTELADVIEAILRPSARGDAKLRAYGSNDAILTLEKVRSLVCQP
jgi:hypothetical protein